MSAGHKYPEPSASYSLSQPRSIVSAKESISVAVIVVGRPLVTAPEMHAILTPFFGDQQIGLSLANVVDSLFCTSR
jgi:hypothetical protein